MSAPARDAATGPLALTNARIVLEDRIVRDGALLLERGSIVGVVPEGELGAGVPRIDVGGRLVTPGLVDIHTHGAVGHLFNDATEEAWRTITTEQARRGVTSLLATTLTASIDDLVACLAFARDWMARPSDGARVLGVHVEGPYFDPAQAGAQDPAAIRDPDDGSVESLLAHADVIRIFTYAPERPGALDLTRRLVAAGIVAAAGHSSALEEDVRAAVDLGLSHAIHIWSAQSSTVRHGPWRKPGLLEASLVFDELTVEMIADGKHLPPTLMRLAYRAIGPDRLCLVSDATNGAGLPDGSRARLGGVEMEVRDGVGMLLDGSAFAGSAALLDEMLGVVTDEAVGVPLVEAVRMASATPARVAGVAGRKGSIAAGKDADLAVFDEGFAAWRTMIAGRWVHLAREEQA